MTNWKEWDVAGVEEFILRAAFPVTSENANRARCVDGRYEGKDLPALAVPGGDAGYLLAGLSALHVSGIDVGPGERKRVADAFRLLVGDVRRFGFHTDEYAEGICRGCGHLAQAEKAPGSYGLTDEDMEFIFAEISSWKKEGGTEVMLRGGHNEHAVLTVDSDCFSVSPSLGGVQVFVFHRTLHERRMKVFGEALSGEFGIDSGKVADALDTAFRMQLRETLHRLTEGMKIYSVSIGKDETGGPAPRAEEEGEMEYRLWLRE